MACCLVDTTANTAYAGRIYLNPTTRTELWTNFGWSLKGRQSFPAYIESLQAASCEQSQYDSIVAAMQYELDERGLSQRRLQIVSIATRIPAFLAGCALMYFIASDSVTEYASILPAFIILGIAVRIAGSCCVYKCRKRLVAQLNGHLVSALDSKKGFVNVRLEVVERGAPSCGNWVDMQGNVLMIKYGKRGFGPGGPPLGYNLVFTCSAPVQVWPPNGPIQMQSSVRSAQVVVMAPLQNVITPERGSIQFCHACGAKLVERARFCSRCGTQVVDCERMHGNGDARTIFLSSER
eukprot:TRINITY_DN48722_c0_g1_i1.p1 TRINITY_DN48722_c0_g1~~TRINITY_DN48722_c0_g1_i1.p1  ORF type:complete len:294 (-),score=3.78 TRINITY_DN48722_c0_g1_i1:94-975(-)